MTANAVTPLPYAQRLTELDHNPARRWLVTGAGGFIGSHLVETLLKHGQVVVAVDNFSTGYRHNIDLATASASPEQQANLTVVEADIRDLNSCQQAVEGCDYVLHQAALGSVPRSLADPICSHQSNIDGFLNMLVAARDGAVKRFVYAASSSTYGDHPGLPKREDVIGKPLSPYAVTKYVNELYANVFADCYGLQCIGLRYFNVFGPRQDPNGAYAAVIPRWFNQLATGAPCQINGDGETSRDFCFINNVVQANLLAALTDNTEAIDRVYNVAVGDRTTLNQVFTLIRDLLAEHRPELQTVQAQHADFRPGDVRHSQADISRARTLLGYEPTHAIDAGLALTRDWFLDQDSTQGATQ